MTSPNKFGSLAHRCLFGLLGIFLVFFVCELASYVGLAVLHGDLDVFGYVRRQQVNIDWEVPDRRASSVGLESEQIHPYFGYVLRGKTPEDRYGFSNSISPIQKKSKDKLILAILGGSVAGEMWRDATYDLVEELKRSEYLKDKEIVPICLAIGGYKQPQQLMVMNYFLSVGAEFDLVINVDGFNEVSSTVVENRMRYVSAGFPREWRARVDPLEPWALKPILILKTCGYFRYGFARAFSRKPLLSHSYTAMVVWKILDHLLYQEIYRQHFLYTRVLPTREIEKIGPFREFLSDEQLYAFMALVWKMASKNIGALGQIHQFRYYHFLQPNLHFPDTKPWSGLEEKYRATNGLDAQLVRKCYPLLREKGKELIREGEKFYDLTDVFKNESATVYSDDCCHLTEDGYKKLARAVGKIIAENYQPITLQKRSMKDSNAGK